MHTMQRLTLSIPSRQQTKNNFFIQEISFFFLFKRSINESTTQSYWLKEKTNEKRDKKKILT